MCREISLRVAEERDIEELKQLRSAAYGSSYEAELQAQKRGELILILASTATRIVGMAYINCHGIRQAHLAEQHALVPELYRLYVDEQFRRRGIASRLLGYAESLLRERGVSSLALGVAKRNPKAKKLYLRLGYIEVKDADFEDSYQVLLENGQVACRTEVCSLLLKKLL